MIANVPKIKVESLSSRERSRGVKPRRGWIKLATGTDRTARGGYAVLGDFLDGGERELPLGAVLVEADIDRTARVLVVGPDGACWPIGDGRWWSLDREVVSMVEAIEAAMASTPAEQMAVVVGSLRMAPTTTKEWRDPGTGVATAVDVPDPAALALLARAEAALALLAPADPRAELRAERERLVARLAEIDAALGEDA